MKVLYKVVKIDGKGFVCVALQEIKPGTLIKIIKERPQIPTSVGSNPVCGFGVRDFWRVRVGS